MLGLLLARPVAPRPVAIFAWVGLAGLWAWSLLSTSWAESADQALVESNRWLLYVAMFGVLVLLLRDDRSSRLLLAAAVAAIRRISDLPASSNVGRHSVGPSWTDVSTSHWAT